MAGKVWMEQEQLQTALKTEVGTPQDSRTQPFTGREQQVLSCVFEGLANKEIAARTLQQLFSKTGVRTRSQLVRIVLEQHRNQLLYGKPREGRAWHAGKCDAAFYLWSCS